ncbi:hypothetical protein FUAX_10500 [Fulvitalea axinellae]|uniref:FecR family protein n=1 Tax=Fulvitalea axinellae TaxID=1182444 RepID=A0AAU9CY97_9BACT|nr:hypothetical protein FUAX_10500 [Fulvitalea axinellae]
MGDPKEKEYSIEDMVLSEDFRRWILEGENNEWGNYAGADKDRQAKLDEASRLVRGLKFKEEEDTPVISAQTFVRVRRTVLAKAKRRRLYRRVASYAASMILVGSLTFWFSRQPLHIENVLPVAKTIQNYYMAERGTMNVVRLTDGSTVWINAESNLSFEMDSLGRRAVLSGEAFFSVLPDKDRPFKVICSGVETVVLGTEFNVNGRNGKVSVALFEGKVSVHRTEDKDEVTLFPGKKIVFSPVAHNYRVTGFDPDVEGGWRYGIIKCVSSPVRDIFERLSRIYNVEFVVAPGVDLDVAYSGSFSNLPLKTVLEGISYSANFEFEMDGDRVLIR